MGDLTGPDHGTPHPRGEFRDDMAEMRADKQDERQFDCEVFIDHLTTTLAVQTQQLRLLTERVDLLVTLVTAVAARL